MIAFWLIAAAMVCAALAVVLPPLLQRPGAGAAAAFDASGAGGTDETEATVRVYRERLAELRREYDRGHLSGDDYTAAEAEAKRELLAYLPSEAAPRTGTAAPRFTMLVTALMIPAVALAVYTASGRPDLLAGDRSDRLSTEQVARYSQMPPPARIRELETHLAEHPEAPRAWSLLAAAYRSEERYREAADAFGRARATGATPDAGLIARQAESRLLASGRRFTPEVLGLIETSLGVDPRNPLGLMLAGHAAYVRGDTAQAVDHWQRLAEQMPEGDPQRQLVDGLIARAEGHPPGATAAAATATADGGDGATITLRLRLGADLRGEAAADDAVFVFARRAGAGDGPPLAVHRTTVGALPAEIELSDAQAMVPSRTLSSAERVVVTARVSGSGEVTPSAGDLEGRTAPIATDHSDPVELTIDQRVQ